MPSSRHGCRKDACDPDRLVPRARSMLAGIVAHPVVRALWEPRLMEAIEWAAQTMRDLKAEGRAPIAAEIFGEARVGDVSLYGKVDRIDRLADDTLAIVDYKTGKPPPPHRSRLDLPCNSVCWD